MKMKQKEKSYVAPQIEEIFLSPDLCFLMGNNSLNKSGDNDSDEGQGLY